MGTTTVIICITFLVVLLAYWIMPVEKMKAVNKELKSLLQILPVSQIIKSYKGTKTNSITDDEP
ncbi:hypothetical protein [Polaribacter cellanae]|uniref:Uncharacterized protein n=1 Tax=Polaribacter cellanae TaxID=2818493 RepID=A0A975H599_9FLAO|nr:hypothetical protein [Polaribacter cellanae]QTE21187.1 hypothetical protein J3359_10060 [Polaribacter cellanae]QTE21196.1 hypothetical protein J3359_10105 [Polaribacter cellanae]